jgi:orotate phosphoribosyltransferase-like protein
VQTLTESGAWKNVFVVVPSGHSVTSFQVLADIIRQKENLAKNQTGSAKDLLGFVQLHKKPVAVLLFDDVIGTGMTASAAIEEVWSILDKEDLTKNVACILFYAVVGFRDVVAYLPLLGLSLSAPKS